MTFDAGIEKAMKLGMFALWGLSQDFPFQKLFVCFLENSVYNERLDVGGLVASYS